MEWICELPKPRRAGAADTGAILVTFAKSSGTTYVKQAKYAHRFRVFLTYDNMLIRDKFVAYVNMPKPAIVTEKTKEGKSDE